ncbi:MAG TPA: hypothetical protein EYP30_05825 [Archaeoglobaceae archaeon]|nr:hypothetical protein [Archaeoglobaceae archaeon]
MSSNIYKIEVETKEDLMKVIAFADPDRRIHLIFSDDKRSFVFYGNSKEIVFTRDRIEPGYVGFEDGRFFRVLKPDKVGPIYFVVVRVKSREFDRLFEEDFIIA